MREISWLFQQLLPSKEELHFMDSKVVRSVDLLYQKYTVDYTN